MADRKRIDLEKRRLRREVVVDERLKRWERWSYLYLEISSCFTRFRSSPVMLDRSDKEQDERRFSGIKCYRDILSRVFLRCFSLYLSP